MRSSLASVVFDVQKLIPQAQAKPRQAKLKRAIEEGQEKVKVEVKSKYCFDEL